MEEWYYAKEDEQNGPITKEELLSLINQEVIIGEDLVWKQGMDDWKQSKEIDALKTQTDSPPAPGLPKSTSNVKEETFFSPEGRLRRKDYFIRVFLLSIPIASLSIISENSNEDGLVAFLGLITICCSILAIIQVVKRLHDINMSGWLWLLSFIPIVNFIFGLYILFKDGTVGANKYGTDPKGRVVESG